jgi:hypothetical protein
MKGYVDSVASQSIYGNVNVKAYTETMGFQNFSNVNVAAYLAAQGVTGGSYSNVNAVSLITGLGLSNYSNVNVKAYTETMGFQNFGNVNVAAYVTTANSAIIGYIDLANTIQSAQVNAANLATIAANLGMKGYVDSVASQSIYGNINVKAYAESMGYQNYGNVNVAAYVTSANSAIIGYIDQANTIQSQQISAANIGVIGYIDQANTIQSQQISAANIGVIGYIDQANTIQSAQVGAANLAITAANVGMKGYVDSQSFYSNTKVATYLQAGNISNVSVAGNVTATYFLGNGALLTGIVAGGSSYSNVQVATYLPTYTGNIANIRLGSSGVLTFADGTTQTTASAGGGSSYGNANVTAYTVSMGFQNFGNSNVRSYLTGGFNGNIVPSANAVYSLGSITNQWKELFVSNTTIYIGGIPISLTNENGLSIDGNLLLTGLGDEVVALGRYAGGINYGGGVSPSLYGNQGAKSVAVGASAGKMAQGANCVAIGSSAGGENQGNADISLGIGGAIAIGGGAGIENQGYHSVSIGVYPNSGSGGNAGPYFRGQTIQGNGAVSLGAYAGASNQGDNAVAIGYRAGISSQYPNSIVINATGNDLDSNVSGLIISPVRMDNSNVANVVYYNTTTKEMTYGPAAGGSYSNVQVATYLPTYSGNIANIRLGSAGILTFPDGTTQTTAASGGGSSYGNANVTAYTVSMGFTNFSNVNVAALITTNGLTNYSNVNAKAYAETMGYQNFGNVNVAAYVTTANSAIIGYIDLANTIQSAQIGAANLAIIAANLGMKGYVDSVASQSIYGNGNVKSYLTQFDGNIIPSANAVYSLGSVTNQWKDVWISSNTIYIAGLPLSSVDGNLTFGGADVGTSGLSTYSGDISAGNISIGQGNNVVTIDGATGNISAGNVNVYNLTTDSVSLGSTEIFSAVGGGGGVTFINLVATTTIVSQYWGFQPSGITYFYVADTTGIEVGQQIYWANNPIGSVTNVTFGNVGNVSCTPLQYVNPNFINNVAVAFGNLTPVSTDSIATSAGELLVDGNISLPDNTAIYNVDANTAVFTTNSINDTTSIYLTDSGNAAVYASDSVVLETNSDGNVTQQWTFNQNGTTTFPGNTTIDSDGNISIGSTTVGNTTTPATFSVEGYTGNISAGNVFVYTVTTDLVDTSNITTPGGNLTITGNVTNTGNITVLQYLNGPPSGNLNISSPTVVTGNITANYFVGNGALLTGISCCYSNVNVIAYLAGNITVGNIAGSVNGYSIGYRDVPQITVANLTLIASDAGKHYYGANTNPTTITIPTNANVAFGNGTAISIVNQGTGNITVANAAGVLLYLAGNTTAGSRTLTSYGMATLIKVQVNTWFINGTGVV